MVYMTFWSAFQPIEIEKRTRLSRFRRVVVILSSTDRKCRFRSSSVRPIQWTIVNIIAWCSGEQRPNSQSVMPSLFFPLFFYWFVFSSSLSELFLPLIWLVHEYNSIFFRCSCNYCLNQSHQSLEWHNDKSARVFLNWPKMLLFQNHYFLFINRLSEVDVSLERIQNFGTQMISSGWQSFCLSIWSVCHRISLKTKQMKTDENWDSSLNWLQSWNSSGNSWSNMYVWWYCIVLCCCAHLISA